MVLLLLFTWKNIYWEVWRMFPLFPLHYIPVPINQINNGMKDKTPTARRVKWNMAHKIIYGHEDMIFLFCSVIRERLQHLFWYCATQIKKQQQQKTAFSEGNNFFFLSCKGYRTCQSQEQRKKEEGETDMEAERPIENQVLQYSLHLARALMHSSLPCWCLQAAQYCLHQVAASHCMFAVFAVWECSQLQDLQLAWSRLH